MEAIEFLREVCRMCKFHECCESCHAFDNNNRCMIKAGSSISPEEQIELVEKWSKEHPRKTRQSVFLDQYPNARLDGYGILKISPCCIDKNFNHFEKGENCCYFPCNVCRKNYWNEEVE